MSDLFLIVNDASLIEGASPAAAQAFGYEMAALCGQPLERVLMVPDRGEGPLASALWKNASQSPVLEGVHRSGRRFPVRLSQHEIQGTRQSHHVLTLHDPAEAIPREGIFSRHRELYELATRQGRISIWEIDYRTNHLQFSPVLANMLGMTAEQIPTTVEEWKRHFHPDDWQNIERQSERTLRHELPEISAECRMYHVDGSPRWTLVRGKPSFDDEGRPIKTVGTSIDITDRKTAETERDLFFTLSLDLLCIADTKGYFRRVNPSFCKVLGYHEDELTSRPFFDFIHPEDLPATQKTLSTLSEGKDVISFENRYRRKDGSWCWLSWTCPAALQGADTVYAIARDVTEAKRVAAELQQTMNEAKKANRAKSEFLSRMSHELRTPLNAILGFGQLLQREVLTSRQHQHLDMMVKGGRYLLNLINEVLDISRIEVGQLDLSPESVELSELIQEVVSLTQPMADQRGIRMTVDHDSLVQHCVLADKQRLKQVLLNLIANAIKYNSERGCVLVRGQRALVNRFWISVQDSGPGISLDKQHRLFTPFDRLGAESTSVEGSGLGLVVSRRLVEIMGGTLAVDSRPGHGTTLTIDLPQHQLPQPRADIIAPAPVVPATVPVAARTLLYIEDNLANLQLIEAILDYRPGIRLLQATQGRLGLELARQQRPDLILLDVHLPDIMGYDLLPLLRADPLLKQLPVIVISADATSAQINLLLDAGATEYLTKPIDLEHFLRVVDRYLQIR